MSSTIIKMNGNGKTSIEALSTILKEEIQAELVSEIWRGTEDLKIMLLTFEKYYLRNGSYASLTVMVTQMSDVQTADIIGYGGGEEIFNISWGANSNFANSAHKILHENGFLYE